MNLTLLNNTLSDSQKSLGFFLNEDRDGYIYLFIKEKRAAGFSRTIEGQEFLNLMKKHEQKQLQKRGIDKAR